MKQGNSMLRSGPILKISHYFIWKYSKIWRDPISEIFLVPSIVSKGCLTCILLKNKMYWSYLGTREHQTYSTRLGLEISSKPLPIHQEHDKALPILQCFPAPTSVFSSAKWAIVIMPGSWGQHEVPCVNLCKAVRVSST